MPKQELDSLLRTGQLKAEAPSAGEIAGLMKSAEDRLRDADRQENSVSSRFDLAYNAAHSFALAALRWHGYRPDQRYIVFRHSRTPSPWPPRSGACWPMLTGREIRSNTKERPRSIRSFSKPFCE